MTIPIVGSVWISYPESPAEPWHWTVFNADTSKPFDDVVNMHITVDINTATMVELCRKASSVVPVVVERYYLVACPGLSGKRVSIPTETTKGVAPCAECGGSGYYVSPVTAKRSPCSAGCKQP